MKFYFILFLFLILPLEASQNFWLGGGVLYEPQKSHLSNNPINKLISFGGGVSFWGSNILFVELGYGLDSSSSYDSSIDRTSYAKIGYEKYFLLFNIITYSGLAYGGLIRTIEAKERSSNWQVGEEDYSYNGSTRRSVVNHMVEWNFGTRLYSSSISGFGLDWNIISLIYSDSGIKYLTTLNFVFILGDK